MSKVIAGCCNDANIPLHDFFDFCADVIVDECQERGVSVEKVSSPNLTYNNVISKVPSAEMSCIAAHGDDKSIGNERKQDVISTSTNNGAFRGKVMYAIACSCAKELKANLFDNGLSAFFGYNDDLVIQEGYGEFGQCAVEGALSLIRGNNLQQAKADMIKKYQDCIDALDSDSPEISPFLNDNLEHLVIEGPDNLTLSL